jgi:hypothetical protein
MFDNWIYSEIGCKNFIVKCRQIKLLTRLYRYWWPFSEEFHWRHNK